MLASGLKSVILLPTYNERENVRQIIPLIASTVPASAILVIDDNSPDGTAEEVEKLKQLFPQLSLYRRPGKQGLGKAYLDTFQKVLADPTIDVVCTMDADLSHDPSYLPKLLGAMNEHDVAIGSRYVPGGSVEGWELWRKLLSWLGNRYCRLITHIPVTDCTSGFVCMRTATLKKVDFSDFDTSGYAFLMYLKYKLWKLGARIKEEPICFKNRITGESKISMNIIQEGLLLPWRLAAKQKKGYPTVTCPMCQNTNATYWFTKNNTKVHRCPQCKLVFMHPIPASAADVYTETYFCGATDGFGYVNYDEDKQNDTAIFHRYIDQIEDHQGTQCKGKLLDVGAATGMFIATARERGWEVTGLEIAPFAAEEGRKKGLTMVTGTLDTAIFEKNSFDCITMIDVFEHFPAPRQAMKQAFALLKPGGILMINTPNAGSLYARIMNKRWPLIIPPEHLHLFNQTSLKRLLRETRFTPLCVTTIGKKFTPAYICQILYTVRHQALWKKLSLFLRRSALNKIAIPINLRDNMFVIARKDI